MSGPPRKIRELRDSDHDYIGSTWFRSYTGIAPRGKPACDRKRQSPIGWVPPDILWEVYAPRIADVLRRHPDWFRVCCSEGDEDQILGWACIEADALHYLYVKRRFRSYGIGRELLHDLWQQHISLYEGISQRIPVTHWTINCEGREDLDYRPSLFHERKSA